jgi:hypothetical protein
MQATRQLEMAFEQCVGFLKLVNNFFCCQILTSINSASVLQSLPACRLIRI